MRFQGTCGSKEKERTSGSALFLPVEPVWRTGCAGRFAGSLLLLGLWRLLFFVGSFLGFLVGEAEEGSDGCTRTGHALLFLKLSLAGDGVPSKRLRFEPSGWDGFSGEFADSVGAVLDAFQRFVDFIQMILLLSEEGESEVAFVGVASCVGLMHAESARLATLCARTERVFCNAVQGVEDLIADLEDELTLFTEKCSGELGLSCFFLCRTCLGGEHNGRQ